jgi:hypothetical protein
VAEESERPADDSSRAPEGRSRGRVYVAAAAMSLGLVGLGVGIGALIWSDDSPTKTAAPTAESNAAAASADGRSPGAGNYNEGATVHIQEGIGSSYTTMRLSPGSDTNCTKDETVGDFPVRDGTETVITMRVRSDLDEGKCFYQASWHTWKVSLPGGGGELGLFEQKGGTAPNMTKWYEAQCQPHWTGGWSCRDDSKYGQASRGEFWLTKTS